MLDRSVTSEPPVGKLKRLEEFKLSDLESVRLILRGDSIIDWHRLNFEDEREATSFLVEQEFHPTEAADRARLERLKNEAISYLRRHFEFPIPAPVARCSVEEILMMASSKGHRQ